MLSFPKTTTTRIGYERIARGVHKFINLNHTFNVQEFIVFRSSDVIY